MCGLFAVHSAASGRRIDHWLRAAADSLFCRGPDGAGFYVHPQGIVGLAHTRLSVMAPLDGQQPLVNEDQTILAIVNGEFYDFESCRDDLQRLGHRFRTQTDSEILIHLYEEYGDACLKYLQGEFAFVLWDEKQQRLFAARDRFGVKPLLYHQTREQLCLASDAKTLFRSGIQADWDPESFSFASTLQYLPPERTLFQYVQMLPPAHSLTLQNGITRISEYWRPESAANERSLNLSVEECQEHVRQAVKCRLRSDAPVCFQLSGGLDSSAVAGIAASETTAPIDVFNICFDEPAYDESGVTERTVEHLNAQRHSVHVSCADILSNFSDAVCASEGLAINGHVAAKFLMHKAMRAAGFKVVLTGEGADEAFLGYTHLRMDVEAGTNSRRGRQDVLAPDRTSVGMMLPSGASLNTDSVFQVLGFVPTWMSAKATLGWKLHQLLNPEFRSTFDHGSVLRTMSRPPRSVTSPVHTSRDLWARTAMAGYILRTLGDGTEMPNSIEGRVPFLDHRLWEFLASAPVDQLVGHEIDKPLLRQSVRGFVTKEVFHRPKHPFDAPPVSVFSRTAAREFLHDHVRSEQMRSQPFFCPVRTLRMLDELDTSDATCRQQWDPALMMVLSTICLSKILQPSHHSLAVSS